VVVGHFSVERDAVDKRISPGGGVVVDHFSMERGAAGQIY